jgi:hypothetical protein
LDYVDLEENIIELDLKEMRIVGEFVWIRVNFIHELCETFHETSGFTTHENNLTRSATIDPSKITTGHKFSYILSDHLNSCNVTSQTTLLKITTCLSL